MRPGRGSGWNVSRAEYAQDLFGQPFAPAPRSSRPRRIISRRSSASARCGRADILLQTVQLRGAGDRHDPRLLGQQPGERDLGGRRALRRRSGEQINQGLVCLRASGVKRGTVSRKSVLSNVVFSSIFPVRNPCPSGLYGTNPMPSASQVGRISAPDAPPQRVFALQGGDRLHGVGPAQRSAPGFGEAEMLDLALVDQFLRHVKDTAGASPCVRLMGVNHQLAARRNRAAFVILWSARQPLRE